VTTAATAATAATATPMKMTPTTVTKKEGDCGDSLLPSTGDEASDPQAGTGDDEI